MKVFINPGHDLQLDPGAVNYKHNVTEAEVVAKAGEMLADYLRKAYCEVDMLQSDDLYEVCDRSNAFDADVFVSLHCNAFNEQARGTETWYKSFHGQRLANSIQSSMIRAHSGLVDRGAKQSDRLLVLNRTSAVAVLVELEFIDNEDGYQILMNDLDKLVRAIARGITDYFVS